MQVILQGSLRHFPAAELMTFLLSRKQNGTLDLDNAGRRTRVLFENEHIVWAESNKVPDAKEAVLDLFEWQGGNFTLLDSLSLPQHATRLSLTLEELHAEARRRAEMLYRDDTMLRVVENQGKAQVSLTGDQFRILFRLGPGRTFGELVSEFGIERGELEQQIKELEDHGLLKSERAAKAPVAPRVTSSAPTPAPVPPAAPAPAPAAVPPPPAAAPPPAPPAAAAPTAPPAAPPPVAPPPPLQPPPANPFEPKTGPLGMQEDVEATRIERAAIQRQTVTPKTVMRPKTLVGSLTPDDRPESVYPLLDSECVIGRAPDCAISVNDGSISSRHARVTRSPEGFSIEDLQSRNGTFVNGERVDKPRLLADGDVVRLGKVIMTFNVARELLAEPKTQMMNFE